MNDETAEKIAQVLIKIYEEQRSIAINLYYIRKHIEKHQKL